MRKLDGVAFLAHVPIWMLSPVRICPRVEVVDSRVGPSGDDQVTTPATCISPGALVCFATETERQDCARLDLANTGKRVRFPFYRWQKEFFENGAAAFEQKPRPIPRDFCLDDWEKGGRRSFPPADFGTS